MNANIKATILAAVMIVAAVAAVSVYAEDADAVDPLEITAKPVEMPGVVENVNWFLTIDFNQSVNGLVGVVVTDADGTTVVDTSANANGTKVSPPLSDEQYAAIQNGFTVTVTVNGLTATYTNIENPGEVTLIGVEVTAPTKTTYTVGETLDLTGMIVEALYTDAQGNETREALTEADYTVSPAEGYKFTNADAGQYPVTVSAIGYDVEFVVTVEGTVGPEPQPGEAVFDADTTITTNVTYDRVTINNGANVTIAPGVTAGLGEIVGTGAITVQSGARMNYSSVVDTVEITNNGGMISVDGGRALGNVINEDTIVSEHSYLTQDTVIAEGVTLTVTRNGTLDLMGFSLEVRGTIVVERGGSVDSTAYGSGYGIVLTSTGAIQNEGVIGNANPVEISNGNGAQGVSQSVEVYRVTGLSVELQRVPGQLYYTMAVHGDVSRVSGSTDSRVTVTGTGADSSVIVSQDTTIGNNVTLVANGLEVANGVTLTIAGSMTGDVVIGNGSAVAVNGSVTGSVTVPVGTVGDGSVVVGTDTTEVVFAGNERGVTVSAGRVTLTENGQPVIYQRAYITGTASEIISEERAEAGQFVPATITVNGTIYVDGTLVIPDEVMLTGGVFDLSSAGTIQVNDRGDSAEISITYIGARYVIETEGLETNYYTGFDAAMGQIASAQNTTVFVSGEFTITGQYTVGDYQVIDVDTGCTAAITIAEEARVEISEDGDFDKDAITLIEGVLFVTGGYGCTPNAGTYAVLTTDSETGDRTYSGFKVALDNAVSGQTITVVGDATYKGSMTVGDGIVVELQDGIVLTVTGNVVVAETAELNLGTGSQLVVGTVGKSNTITVNGTLDSEFGKISAVSAQNADGTISYSDVDLYSTGTTNAGTNGVAIDASVTANAAYYDDVQRVYTSVAEAVAYAEANGGYPGQIYIVGELTERDDIATTVDIVVLGKAVLGNITLNGASISVNGGTYTAVVSGLTGAGADAATSTVSVTETTATVANVVTVTAAGEDDSTTTIDAVAGRGTSVTAGSIVFVGTGITTSESNTLSVSSGAELVLDNEAADITVDFAQGLTNAGTITVQNGVIASGTVGGQLAVADDSVLTVNGTLAVTGTLTVSSTEDREGTLMVNGILQLGETPEMLGAVGDSAGDVVGQVTLGTDGNVVSYAGSSVAEATIVQNGDDAVFTAYNVNGTAVATVYGNGYITSSAVDAAVKAMRDLDAADRNALKWYVGEDEVSNNARIGDYDEVSTELEYATADIIVSIGPRLTLSIDGIVINPSAGAGLMPLTIGTHTVSVVVDPGYSGDVTITFNGQTVSNGQIEVTSDMIDADDIILSVTGSISQDSSTVVVDNGGNGDGGMGLTEILLIILVILIVIMAIIVALRLMRS